MGEIDEFYCSQDNNYVRWRYLGEIIEKKFEDNIYAECFLEKDGVVVVIRTTRMTPSNACIINPDGSIRTFIRNPFSDNGGIFTDVYHILNRLNLIVFTNLGQFSCLIDKQGEITEINESR